MSNILPCSSLPTPTYPDGVPSLYYYHTVADDYSNTRFDTATIDDGGKEEEYYTAAYIDGHTQNGVYKTKDINGYIVEVNDEEPLSTQMHLYTVLAKKNAPLL